MLALTAVGLEPPPLLGNAMLVAARVLTRCATDGRINLIPVAPKNILHLADVTSFNLRGALRSRINHQLQGSISAARYFTHNSWWISRPDSALKMRIRKNGRGGGVRANDLSCLQLAVGPSVGG